jgi:hypothetical protein
MGRSIRKHLRAFTIAADYGSRESKQIFGMIERSGYILPDIGSSSDPSHYLNFLRRTTATLAETFREESPELREVLQLIAADAVSFGPGELKNDLVDRLKKGFDLCALCLEKWGGPEAQIRAKSLHPVPLTIQASTGTHSVITVTTNNGQGILLRIGEGKNFLSNYLSLDFYFFHEFLSHVFPIWSDLAGKLAEGHLMAIEELFFREYSDVLTGGEFTYLSEIVADDFAHHLQQGGRPGGNDFYRKAAKKAGRLELTFERGFIPKLFLELAAGSAGKVTEVSGHEKLLLDNLEKLALVRNRRDIEQCLRDMDWRRIHTELIRILA